MYICIGVAAEKVSDPADGHGFYDRTDVVLCSQGEMFD